MSETPSLSYVPPTDLLSGNADIAAIRKDEMAETRTGSARRSPSTVELRPENERGGELDEGKDDSVGPQQRPRPRLQAHLHPDEHQREDRAAGAGYRGVVLTSKQISQ
jgi:hypothetical protein